MKDLGKTVGFIVVGIILVVCVIRFCLNAGTDTAEKEETTALLQLKMQEKSEIVEHQMGEDVQSGDFLWNVESAEIIAHYSELDSYYQQLEDFSIYQTSGISPERKTVPEDCKYLKLKYSVKNTSDKKKRELAIAAPHIMNKIADGSYSDWMYGNFGIGGNYLLNDDTTEYPIEVNRVSVFLNPGDKVTVELVIGFGNIEDNMQEKIENLYLNTCQSLRDYYMSNTGNSGGEQICLNVNPETQGIVLQEQQDVITYKSEKYLNEDLRLQQTQGYPIKFEGQENYIDVEEVASQDYIFKSGQGITIQMTGSKVYRWEEMPEVFKTQGNLQKMADRYKDKKGYTTEQLKVLVLDVKYEAPIDETTFFSNGINLYSMSYLFTRDEDGKRWIFGVADDWSVIENTEYPEETGYVSSIRFDSGFYVNVQIAYILPPEVENEQALYYAGGYIADGNYSNTPIVEIPLE